MGTGVDIKIITIIYVYNVGFWSEESEALRNSVKKRFFFHVKTTAHSCA